LVNDDTIEPPDDTADAGVHEVGMRFTRGGKIG
jgi:hypothetical protein